MIKLGSRVKDKITGFEGIAIASVTYLTGCEQIGITPPLDKDGKLVETQYFDITRLEVIDDAAFIPADRSNIIDIKDSAKVQAVGGVNRDAPKR